jgi:3-hydroxyethyl bacteriochlorophyllide a dehydrogenase
MLALAATALRAVQRGPEGQLPELVVGHGVLGRLVARITLALGGDAPVVWEREPLRRSGAAGYAVVAPEEDTRRDYRLICDVSGANGLLDTLIGCLAPGGCVVLAGFYHAPVSFAFPPAFMREAQLRISAEWQQDDLKRVLELVAAGRLSLQGLITHRAAAGDAARAYRAAFEDVDCVKMVLDWRQVN